MIVYIPYMSDAHTMSSAVQFHYKMMAPLCKKPAAVACSLAAYNAKCSTLSVTL